MFLKIYVARYIAVGKKLFNNIIISNNETRNKVKKKDAKHSELVKEK